MNRCWPLSMPPTNKSVLMALAHLADDEGCCTPSLSTLAGLTCFERTTIIEAVKWLESSRALMAERSPGRPTRIVLTPGSFAPLAISALGDWGEGPASDESKPVGQANGIRRPAVLPCPYERIVEAYHAALPNAPRVFRLTEQRREAIRARWREFATEKEWTSADEGVAFFARFFAFVGESPFLTGRTPPTDGRPPFVADLEWLMRQSNFVKAAEGRYHPKESRGK